MIFGEVVTKRKQTLLYYTVGFVFIPLNEEGYQFFIPVMTIPSMKYFCPIK